MLLKNYEQTGMTMDLNHHKILLIEDYAAMRASIKEMLYRGGNAHHISSVDNAATALLTMEKESFTIVLCDYNLGIGQTGQQLLEEVKYRKLLPSNAIFIMVTAEQSPSMVLSAMDNKPDEYLIKPFNTTQLLSRIEKQLIRKAYFADIDAAIDIDDLPVAIAHCDKLLRQRDPKMRTQLLKVRAELSTNVGDFKTAEQCYQEVLAQRDLAWAKHGLGIIAYLQHNFVTAIDLFNEVLESAPMMIENYDWLTKAYESVEKLREAQKSILQAVELSPQAILRQRKLALLAEQLGNDQLAFKAYRSAIRFGTYSIHKSSLDFARLAKLYYKFNNLEDAFKIIKEMRRVFRHNLEAELRAVCLEAEIYFKQHKLILCENAYARIRPITKQNKNIPKNLLLDIIEIHHSLGNLNASNSLLENVIGNYVDDDDFMKALVDRHKSFSKDDFYADQLYMRTKLELLEVNNHGVNLFKQGEISSALVLLETAHNKTPNNKVILLNLIKILLQDIKESGITKEKQLFISKFLLKATSLDIPKDEIGHIKVELAKLIALNNTALIPEFS